MCGQWSEEGYMHGRGDTLKKEMVLEDWKKIIDEVSAAGNTFVLLRGGEPFLFPGIMDLIRYIKSKGMFTAIDTNGTVLTKYADDLVKTGDVHLTISVDGTREVHDEVRGFPGTYDKIKENILAIREAEKREGNTISLSLNFTISGYNYHVLGQMPGVARELGVQALNKVPYYYLPDRMGQAYARELKEHLGCRAYTWTGFRHEDSGVDTGVFRGQLRQYLDSLGDINDVPYLPMTEDEYVEWFANPDTTVKSDDCQNVEMLADIQPDGSVNFCVDYPDYSFGNVKEKSLKELWNSPEAEKFRIYRRKQPLQACHRCGAKYMSLYRG
jgi:radical SAM protein with 4Fe4S-binding SPASM domain